MEHEIKALIERYYASTGIEALDELILGWRRGGVSLLYGNFKSGKTTLATFASVVAMSAGKHALYVDTENAMTPIRVYMLAKAMRDKGLISNSPDISALFHLYNVSSLAEQHDVVMNEVSEKLSSMNVGLVVIDSVANFFHSRVLQAPREYVAAVAREVMGKISTEVSHLQTICGRREIPVIVTTWNASKAGYALAQWQKQRLVSEIRKGKASREEIIANLETLLGADYMTDFIGGQFLGYRAHILLRLFRLAGPRRFAYLAAHRDRPDGYGLYMTVTEAGLLPEPGAKPLRVDQILYGSLEEEEKRIVEREVGAGPAQPEQVEPGPAEEPSSERGRGRSGRRGRRTDIRPT
jgi:RecA/RadA recombinase